MCRKSGNLNQESSELDAGIVCVDDVIVFASSLGDEGATYSVLGRAALADAQANEQQSKRQAT